MVEYKVETMTELQDELNPLFEAHWEEVALYKELPLKPNWELYGALEDKDALVFITARNDGKLVGYTTWLLCPSLHYADYIFASNDLIFLDYDHRDAKHSKELLEFSETILKQNGAHLTTLHMKTYAAFESLAVSCEYDKQEYLYTKLLG
tara:strand:- start:1328 stop:1777 length:450 start_codon:yes stop_codon:yes gene_type:complete